MYDFKYSGSAEHTESKLSAMSPSSKYLTLPPCPTIFRPEIRLRWMLSRVATRVEQVELRFLNVFMRARKLHRSIGIVLVLPFFGWAITGLIFFIKPGYPAAYETLSPRTYPLTGALPINPDPAWLELRSLRTVLGDHLLVRTNSGWQHLNPTDKQPRTRPNESEVKLLLKDAFSVNPARYGNISRVSGDKVWTDTGVEVSIDWNRMSLQQRGKDTDWIDLLYRIHYLQWTGVKSLDKIVGFTGLVLVMVLTTLGAWLAFKRS
jgi:hypothetical protein